MSVEGAAELRIRVVAGGKDSEIVSSSCASPIGSNNESLGGIDPSVIVIRGPSLNEALETMEALSSESRRELPFSPFVDLADRAEP